MVPPSLPEHLEEDWVDEAIGFEDEGDDLEVAGSTPAFEHEATGQDHAYFPAEDQILSSDTNEVPPSMGDPFINGPDDSTDAAEERQCRICFGSDTPEEVDELGRLISPCLCSGTMSHVHVRCINEWRGKGRNKQTFYQCIQCRFQYRFNRTLFFGLATSRPLILLTSMLLFLLLTLTTGQLLLMLLNSSAFDRWIRRPLRFAEEEMERQTQMAFGSDTTAYGWGIGYGSMSGGLLDIVIRAVNVFASGEAEEVVVEGLRRVAEVAPVEAATHGSKIYHQVIDRVPINGAIGHFLQSLLTRISLGFSFIGSLSFISLLISSSLLAPFQLANNLRFGRFGWGRVGRQRRAAEGGVGLGTVVIVIAVCAGAVRAIKQLYGLTNQLSQYILLKAETAILEVNPKGEVLAFQPVLEDQAVSERQRRLDAVVLDN